MVTAANVIDRAYRDFLTPPEAQAVETTLAAAINSSVTTVTYDDGLLTAEEAEMLGVGQVIEVGSELMRVTSVDEDANSLTVTRGVMGTTAASHSEDDVIRVQPQFPRQQVFDVLSDVVEDLYPTLFGVATDTVSPSSTQDWVEAPAAAMMVQRCWLVSNGAVAERPCELLTEFPPSTTTEKAWLFPHTGSTSASFYVTYRKKFTRPSSESSTFDDMGLDEAWQTLLVAGTVARLLPAMDVDAATSEYLTEQLESQVAPPTTGLRLESGYRRWFESMLDRAHARLISQHGIPTRVRRALG